MIDDLIGQERIVANKDWATLLFVLCFVVIVITKAAFENRFSDFSKLIVSDKYNKIYKESSQLFSWFNISFIFVQFISISFFIQLVLVYFGYASKYDWVLFIQLITFSSVFVFSKYLIEKINFYFVLLLQIKIR
jgi:hypothetical protein